MKLRILATTGVVFALLATGVAGAATGPPREQRLAVAQTQHLFRHLHGEQTASPRFCNEGQWPRGIHGAFLLPTLSFAPGDESFTCFVRARTVVLDLSGAVATEDTNLDMPYETESGEEWLYTRDNLERICDDILPRYYPAPVPATVDGRPIGGVAVSTEPFRVRINRTAPLTYWQDSMNVGHPGWLWATYCGWKAELELSRGHHVIEADFSALFGGTSTRFRYDIWVLR